jgi:hypothetical protein
MSDPWADFVQPQQGADSWADFIQPAQQDPGLLANSVRALRMGLPFGNQMVAAEKTILPQSLGGSKGFDYGANLADVNAADAQLQQQHPHLAALGQGTTGAGLSLLAPGAALGEGAGIAPQIARGAGAGFGIGALQGAGAPGSDIRNLPETAENAIKGGYAGGALGGALPAAGALAGKAISPLAAGLSKEPVSAGALTPETIGPAKTAAYKAVDELGASYSPEAFSGLVTKIADDAKAANLDPDLHKGAASVINNLQRTAESGEPITLTQLDQKRQLAARDSSGTPADKFFGSQIRNNIDDFIKNQEPTIAGAVPTSQEPGPLPSNLKRNLDRQGDYHAQIRDLYDLAVEHGIVRSRLQFDNPSETQANQIQDLYNQFKVQPWDPNFRDPNNLNLPDQWPINPPANYPTGGENAGLKPTPQAPQGNPAADAIQNARDLNTRYMKSQALAEALKDAELRTGGTYSGGNIDNATRQNLRRVLKKGNFTPDETEQYTNAIMGGTGQNTARLVGKMLNPSGIIGFAEASRALAGDPSGLAAAGIGYGAKKVSDAMTQANVKKLMATILAGGKGPVAPPATGLAYPRASLAAALGLNANLQSPQPQNLSTR